MSKSSGKRGMTTLVIDESSLRAVRGQLTDEALVVASERREIAHETLVRRWPRNNQRLAQRVLCQAERAPGSNVTRAPAIRDGSRAENSVSTRTVPGISLA
jgi:hypothetical protein